MHWISGLLGGGCFLGPNGPRNCAYANIDRFIFVWDRQASREQETQEGRGRRSSTGKQKQANPFSGAALVGAGFGC